MSEFFFLNEEKKSSYGFIHLIPGDLKVLSVLGAVLIPPTLFVLSVGAGVVSPGLFTRQQVMLSQLELRLFLVFVPHIV